MVFQLAEREVLVNVLAHLEAGLNIERDLCDDAKGAEPHDCAMERLAIVFARQIYYLARCSD